jgi:exopolyphosphatase / guanosine-5'-triphosphate,3'-diphosphate pyrophosphatase
VDHQRRAVIDVGTNSVKLLVADVTGTGVSPVFETSRQTRLGQGFYTTHRIQAEPILKTAAAVADFAAKARECQAVSVRVLATSAAREALNADELTAAIENASGLRVEIISGEREANLGFCGVATDGRLAEMPLMLLDVGGGSTEFILGRGANIDYSASFQLGTVRLLEQLPVSDPPLPAQLANCRRRVREFLQQEVQPRVDSARIARQGWEMVAIGGTASILGCMEAELTTFDRDRLESTLLSLDRLRWYTTHLWGLPIARRREVIGLPSKRADVILTGVVIYEAVMEQFAFGEMRISTRGLRFAALLEG